METKGSDKDILFDEDELKRIKTKYGSSDLAPVNTQTLEALRNGSHLAFEAVYLRGIAPLTDFMTLLVGSQEEAKEITQEVFTRLWETREGIDPHGNFKGYLFAIAKFSVFDKLALNKVAGEYQRFKLSVPEDYRASLNDETTEDELLMLMKVCLENMPAQRRRVFEMSKYEGLSNDEIAARLNISKKTVWSHINNAMKSLKEFITIFIFLFIA